MTRSEIEAAKKRCEAATRGPWIHTYEDGKPTEWVAFDEEEGIAECLSGSGPHDADFIAHARTDLPKALASLESLTATLELAEKALEKIADTSTGGYLREIRDGNADIAAAALAEIKALESKR